MVGYGWESPGLTPDGTHQSLLLLCLQPGLAAGGIPWESLGPPKLSHLPRCNNTGECDMNRNYFICSERNKRPKNEDSFLVCQLLPLVGREPVTILALADGMGGYAHGEHISREALRTTSAALFEQLCVRPALGSAAPTAPNFSILSQALSGALEQGNAYVRRVAKNNSWGKAGTTIVIAAIWKNGVVAANLGDSLLFHYRLQNRALSQVTPDHSVAGALLRSGLISPEMAAVHSGRHQLEFYLGCDRLPKEKPIRLPLAPGDLLLLCSDGISGSLLPGEIASILAAADLEAIGKQLIRVSRSNGATDNQTLILWRQPTTTGGNKGMGHWELGMGYG